MFKLRFIIFFKNMLLSESINNIVFFLLARGTFSMRNNNLNFCQKYIIFLNKIKLNLPNLFFGGVKKNVILNFCEKNWSLNCSLEKS